MKALPDVLSSSLSGFNVGGTIPVDCHVLDTNHGSRQLNCSSDTHLMIRPLGR